MTINWNPHAKQQEGLEHASAGYSHVKSDTYQDQWAVTFEAEHTGALTDVQIFLPPSANASFAGPNFNNLYAPVMAELHAEGNEATGVPIHEVFAPTNLLAFSGDFTLLDWAYGTPDLADIVAPSDGLGFRAYGVGHFDVQFDVAAFPLTRRIMRMGVGAQVNQQWGYYRFTAAGYPFWSQSATLPTAYAQESSFYHGEAWVEYGASSWQWWTPTHIRNFRSGGAWFYKFFSHPGSDGTWLFDSCRMHVISVPENRIGVGLNYYVPSSIPAEGTWFNIPMKTPAATGAPSVTSGSRYTLIIRRTGGDSAYPVSQNGASPFRYLRGFSPETDDYLLKPVIQKVPDLAATHAFTAQGDESYWQNGTIQVTGLGTQVEGIAAVRWVSGGVAQPESQPYSNQEAGYVFGIHDIATTNAPSTGYVLTQSIAMSGTGELYGQVIATVGYDRNNPPASDLAFEVRNNVNAIVLSGAQITPGEWNALPDNLAPANVDSIGTTYKRIRVLFPIGGALSAGTYSLIAKSPATSESAPWKVGILTGTDTGTLLAKNQSMSGTLEQATGAKLSSDPSVYTLFPATGLFAEAQMVLSTVPAAPANPTATAILVGAHHVDIGNCAVPGDTACAEETVPGILVSWNAVVEAGIIGYQVQRQDEGGEFTLVAMTTTATSWTDFESEIGNLVCYRVRAVRDDGATGTWSAIKCASIPEGRIALSFTSNWATGMGAVYPEAWETDRSIERDFNFAEYDDVERRMFYGKNGQASFHPVERRGVIFTRTLLLNALVTVAQPTLDIAKPLRDISWAQIPYVCVRDGEGNRWFASIRVPRLTNKRRGERWFSELEVAEATTIPSPVDTQQPQVTTVGFP